MVPCGHCGEPVEASATTHWISATERHRVDEPPEGEAAGRTNSSIPDTRSEKQIQAAIVEAVETLGGSVYDLSQDRATRQTPGLPDLLVWYRTSWTWAEVKRPAGQLSPAQETFRDRCLAAGAPWACWRSEADAFRWLDGVRESEAA